MYTKCEQKMVERCDTECKDKGGAIFCDGQFVNAADAHDCADELKAKIKIDNRYRRARSRPPAKIFGKAASNVSKQVDKNVDIDSKCSVANVGSSGTRGAGALLALPLLGLAIWRTRRRNAGTR